MGDVGGEWLERMGAANGKKAASVAVGVYISNGFLSERRGVVLDPFDGAEQARFLAVPSTEDERAFRAPAGLGEFANGPGLLEHRDEAADGVARADDRG